MVWAPELAARGSLSSDTEGGGLEAVWFAEGFEEHMAPMTDLHWNLAVMEATSGPSSAIRLP